MLKDQELDFSLLNQPHGAKEDKLSLVLEISTRNNKLKDGKMLQTQFIKKIHAFLFKSTIVEEQHLH